MPLFYLSNEYDYETVLDSITLVNIISGDQEFSEWTVWIVVLFTICYSMMGHTLIYYFEAKRKELKKKEGKEDYLELTETQIATHVLILKGVNSKLSKR